MVSYSDSALHILVADDDPEICGLVALYLENAGFRVQQTASGDAALAAALSQSYDLILLDVMLPGVDGFEVARRLRTQTHAPILFLSARDRDIDKAMGLNLGADDYITKPFSPLELVARVHAHLRRARRYQPAAPPSDAPDATTRETTHHVGPVQLDARSRRVWVRGAEINLTATEFDLLQVLVSEPGRVFTKQQLIEAAWGAIHLADENTLMVHIRRLRTKTELDASQPALIQTVWGIGYRFGPIPQSPTPPHPQ